MGHFYDCKVCGEEKGAGGCACSRVDPRIKAKIERITTSRCTNIIRSYLYRSEDEAYRKFILGMIAKVENYGYKKT